MRVFLCTFGDYYLAIPMNCVSSLMLFTRPLNEELFQRDGDDTFFYLPALFGVCIVGTRYGMIIKNSDNDEYENKDRCSEENDAGKNILITGEIECEIEIPDNALSPLPEIFSQFRFSRFFNGILFGSVSNTSRPVLVLNPNLSFSYFKEQKL